jgi:hypothetical protein
LGGQVLFGSATTTDVAVMEAAIGGKVGIRRSYYQASQVSAAVDRARADLVAGRVPWLSFKAPASWASMASGAGDAWAQDLANRLGGLPGPVWVAVHHEPEGDGPAADWKAMQQRLSPIFRAKPNIAYTMILMGWNQFFANKADQSLDVYWPGKQHIDVLGFDPYNWYDTTNSSGGKNYSWTELREYYTKIKAWLDATGNSEVKWAVAETGYTDTAAAMAQNGTAPNGKKVSTLGTGADWLTRAYDDMKAMGGIALTYFNVSAATNNEPADWTWPLNTTKTTTYTTVLATSNRITDAPLAGSTGLAATGVGAGTGEERSEPTSRSAPAGVSGGSAAAGKPQVAVRVTARRSGRVLHVNVNPNKGRSYWRFRVERLNGTGRWVPKKMYRTHGSKEIRTINLKKGTYRVVVLAKHGYQKTPSQPATLRK